MKDRNNQYADEIEISLIHESEYTDGDDVDFIYREENDAYVIYNPKTITSAENGYFEVSYSTSEKTIKYADMAQNDSFRANMSVSNLSATTTPINVYINTKAELVSINKRYPVLYTTWEST